MSDFKAEIQKNSILAGALPQTPLGQCSPRPLAGFKGPYFSGEGRGGNGRGGEGKGGEERGYVVMLHAFSGFGAISRWAMGVFRILKRPRPRHAFASESRKTLVQWFHSIQNGLLIKMTRGICQAL